MLKKSLKLGDESESRLRKKSNSVEGTGERKKNFRWGTFGGERGSGERKIKRLGGLTHKRVLKG